MVRNKFRTPTLGCTHDSASHFREEDEAFVAADGMLMVRKANRLIRIMYITCPCSTDAVKPLAKEIAAAL